MDMPRTRHPELPIDVDRVAFAGCWHANLDWAETALRSAAERHARVLVHTGDFGYTYTPTFVVGINDLARQYGITIAFVDGNHDNHDYLRRLEENPDGTRRLTDHVHYLPRGLRWKWNGVSFLALGGARSIDRARRYLDQEPYWWQGETVQNVDIAKAVAPGQVDVMVSHDSPSGVVIPNFDSFSDRYGDVEILAAGAHRRSIRRVVDEVRPKLIIHGHYHAFYTRQENWGWGEVKVIGLDRDGSSAFRNVVVLDINEIRQWVTR